MPTMPTTQAGKWCDRQEDILDDDRYRQVKDAESVGARLKVEGDDSWESYTLIFPDSSVAVYDEDVRLWVEDGPEFRAAAGV